jgi:undecaprenyl-diphosphatase
MTRLFEIAGPYAPLAVFLLAAAESAAFVGVFVPGELAVILGGVAAGTGGVSVFIMIPAAVAGAIVGDSIGYRLGYRVGPALLARPKMQRVSERMDSAAAMLSRQGWWALVVARFAAVLRAVVPFAAGMARMPYRRFLLGNAVGGVLWGTAFTLVGYFTGANYPAVERWIRTGGLAVVVLVLLIGGIIWGTRWVQQNREAIGRIAGRASITGLIDLVRRPDRSAMTLAIAGAAAIGGMWAFAGLAQDVIGTEEFFLFDLSAMTYLSSNQVPILVWVARVVDAVTDPLLLTGLAIGAAATALARRRFRLTGAIATATLGQWAIVELTARLVDRTPPGVEALVARIDYGFPSEQVALAAAVAVLLVWPWSRRSWQSIVSRFGAATLAVTLVAASRVILLTEYPSDVLAGAAIAGAWTLLVCLALAGAGGASLHDSRTD